MVNHNLRKYLLNNQFVETTPWIEFKHPSGLHVSVDDHEWSIDHIIDEWSEDGNLNNTSELYGIIAAELKSQ